MAIELPAGLDRERHVERSGHSPWPRRVAVVLLAAAVVLALLNTFGQQATVTTASVPSATLTVDSPERLRGGLVFTSEFTVTAHNDIHDVVLLFSTGWWRGMTLNAAAPQPSNESSSAQGISYEYGELQPGEIMHVWISWQTNPTTAGTRDQDVTLLDGAQPIITMQRSFTVFP